MRRRVDLTVGWAETENDFDHVEIGDRLVARLIHVNFPGSGGQPALEMTIDSSSGVPRCTELRIASTDGGREVRTADVRAVAVENWIEAITPVFMDEITERGADGSISSVVRVADSDADYTRKARTVLREARRSGRRKVTPAFLKRVAEVYLSEDDRPAENVELAFGVSARTAFRYISLAREQGFLEEREP